MFSIKAASEATGLGVETLRAWERRYRVVIPERDGSGRRIYSAEDVVRLRRLREATDRGHPIGRLFTLSDSELGNLLRDTGPESASRVFVNRILNGVEAFDPAECEQALMVAIATFSPTRLMVDVLGPLMTEVGERWHRGDLSIAQEHMVSAMVRRHVSLVLQTFDRCSKDAGIVFSTLPGERHEIGLLMAASVCASMGHKTHYLGPDMPAEQIAAFAARTKSPVVALSLIDRTGLEAVATQVSIIAEQAGSAVTIWLGGSAATRLDARTLPKCCVVLEDEFELERRLQMLNGG